MLAHETILLVADNPDDVLLTQRVLKKNNICNQVVVAQHGAEALEYLFGMGSYQGRDLNTMAQVILLDLDLPKIEGLEVLKRIRSDERTRLLRTVTLTSSEEQEDLVESYGLGANSYVRNPVDMDQFREAVRELGMYWVVLNETPQR